MMTVLWGARLKVEGADESPGTLLEAEAESDQESRRGLRLCIFNKLPGGVTAAGPWLARHAVWVPSQLCHRQCELGQACQPHSASIFSSIKAGLK